MHPTFCRGGPAPAADTQRLQRAGRSVALRRVRRRSLYLGWHVRHSQAARGRCMGPPTCMLPGMRRRQAACGARARGAWQGHDGAWPRSATEAGAWHGGLSCLGQSRRARPSQCVPRPVLSAQRVGLQPPLVHPRPRALRWLKRAAAGAIVLGKQRARSGHGASGRMGVVCASAQGGCPGLGACRTQPCRRFVCQSRHVVLQDGWAGFFAECTSEEAKPASARN